MALERFVIEELGGLNRNLVDGLGKQPDELRGALMDRMGGYRYYGKRKKVHDLFDSYSTVAVSENRYGLFKSSASTLHRIYGLNLVFPGESDMHGWNPYVAASASQGVSLGVPTPYFSVPGVRYGPWYVPLYTTSANGQFFKTHDISTAAPYVEYEFISNASLPPGAPPGTIEAGTYNFHSACLHNAQRGRLVFHVDKLFTTVTATATGQIVASIISGKGFDGVARVYSGTGFIGEMSGTGGMGDVVFSAPEDIKANSDIFINPNHDIAAFHDGRFYYGSPTVFNAFVTGSSEPWNGPGWTRLESIIRDIQRDNKGPENYVIFTEVMPLDGATNMTKSLNYFQVTPLAGRGINALMSSPAGLMVFCENEIFLFRGDPIASPKLIRFSGTIGNTPGISPVALSGVVFNIYGGEIYSYSLGMGDIDFGQGIAKIGMPVYLPSDPFIKLAADPQNNFIIAMTESNKVFMYDAGSRVWAEHPFSGDAGLVDILNFGGANNSEGSLFLFSDGDIDAIDKKGAQGVGDGDMEFGFEELDFGDKRAKKLFRSVEIYVNPGYAGTAAMEYQVGEMVTAASVTAEILPEGRQIFRLPAGFGGSTGTFKFKFSQMGANDVVEPPIVFNYVPKGRRRI